MLTGQRQFENSILGCPLHVNGKLRPLAKVTVAVPVTFLTFAVTIMLSDQSNPFAAKAECPGEICAFWR